MLNSHRMKIENWELSINGFFCASCVPIPI
jgi:hypothetical protein